MRYIDNSHGDPQEEALFAWLRTVLTADVIGIRLQSGFFEPSVLGVFMPSFRRLANEDQDAIVLIGSNDGETLSTGVHQLVDGLGLPRPNALLGVVSYANGFYHPKTIHLRYQSGREIAYIGSANLTSRGLNGLNIEAGIILDTDEGDPADILNHVKRVPREWFDSHPGGLFKVVSHDDVDRLEAGGILRTERVVPTPRVDGGELGHDPLPFRVGHHVLPPIPDNGMEEDQLMDKSVDQPESDDLVLIAELSGPGRWGQAAFPQWFIDNFFEVPPGEYLHLLPVTQPEGLGEAERTVCGYKAGSRNWYFELGLAAAAGAYPQQPPKPIGVFHRIAPQTCRYAILMPDDESYPHVASCLRKNRTRLNRPSNELPRTIIPAKVLRNFWPRSWFFED